jgi:hypothetical protein
MLSMCDPSEHESFEGSDMRLKWANVMKTEMNERRQMKTKADRRKP